MFAVYLCSKYFMVIFCVIAGLEAEMLCAGSIGTPKQVCAKVVLPGLCM